MPSFSGAGSGMMTDFSRSSLRELSLAGFPSRVFHGDPEFRDNLDPWLDLFVADGIGGTAAPPLEFHFAFAPDAALPPAPAGGRPLIEYLYVSGWRDGDRTIFRGADGSMLEADPAAGRAFCRIPRSTAGGPPWVIRDLFNAALATFLRARGRHPLHAAAVTRDDHAILIAAPSMSGKSWLAVNFVR